MSECLCCYAFEVLNHKLVGEPKISFQKFVLVDDNSDLIPSSAPLFVTWNRDGNLRGCIGTFQDLPIESGVRRFSITSALEDSRFAPISKHELPSLLVHVTLLANFTDIHDSEDWEVGKNGLKVSFDYQGIHYSGTFLPSVAEEEKWDKTTTLYYLLKKAGLSGVSKHNTNDFYKTAMKENWLRLTRYDGLKASLDYGDYRDIRSDLS